METVSIAIPKVLLDFANQRIVEDGYCDLGEYVRELIRLDQRSLKQASIDSSTIEQILGAMTDSMAGVEIDDSEIADIFEPQYVMPQSKPRKKRQPRIK
jgi:Arc/MetJ-type ribon-helix-helix transcriptional regulator